MILKKIEEDEKNFMPHNVGDFLQKLDSFLHL